jgi:signal transduction histidine kinase
MLSQNTSTKLDEVIITPELSRRTPRSSDLGAENKALVALAAELARSPQTVLQTVVDYAVKLCQADTAGISLLEVNQDEEIFRLRAISGDFQGYIGNSIPRNLSASGTCVDRGEPQLFTYPYRYFTYVSKLPSAMVESLGVPLQNAQKQTIGTIWVGSYNELRKFDKEDVRLLKVLADFAVTALQVTDHDAQLRNALHMRDSFLSMCSHEIKTPMTSLKLQAQIVKRHFSADDAQAFPVDLMQKLAEHMDGQIDRLTWLVDDMLEVARITSGQLPMRRQSMNLLELVEKVAKRFECPIEVQAAEPICGNWDQTRIEQVLTNLITNATRYSSNKPIRIELARENSKAKLIVQDHGIGIDKKDQKRIFQRFERASANSKGGFGLGLYIANKIIEAHSGSIAVESELGKGSSFIVELPI